MKNEAILKEIVMKINKHTEFFDRGFEAGLKCSEHIDQAVQEEWNKTVLLGKITYFDFKSWELGYLIAKEGKIA